MVATSDIRAVWARAAVNSPNNYPALGVSKTGKGLRIVVPIRLMKILANAIVGRPLEVEE